MGSSIWNYVGSAAYTSIGQPEQYNMGPSNESASLTYTYEEGTGRLHSSALATVTTAGTTPVTLDNATYTYSNAGTIQNEADTPSGSPPQVQCFSYDYLGRLSQAWAQGSTGCVASMSQSAESGAAAPYWDQYSYDTSGDLTGVTSTPATGAATTDTSVFPAAGQPQAHGLTAQHSAGPGGTATTSYGYDAAGHTTSIAAPSSSQSLNWNDAGQLASDTVTGSGAGTTGYVYDASGNLLLQSDPGSITLCLPDEQVVYDTSTKAITATRYYSINGQVTAARSSAVTATGTITTTVTYLDSNQQGTATAAADAGLQPGFTYMGGGGCGGICGSASYGLAFSKSAFTPSGTPPRTRAPHLLFPGLAAIASACAATVDEVGVCVPALLPVAPAVRGAPRSRLSPTNSRA